MQGSNLRPSPCKGDIITTTQVVRWFCRNGSAGWEKSTYTNRPFARMGKLIVINNLELEDRPFSGQCFLEESWDFKVD